MLNEKEKKRYNRHLILDSVREEGQKKLKAAKVLVIGAGGLGCPILQYLTAAGVGKIGIVDNDKIDYSNLQRQVLYSTEDVEKGKAETAAHKLAAQNEFIDFEVFNSRLTNQNAIEIFQPYDIIVDGTDNFTTRYLINDACVLLNKPLVYGAIFKFEGQVSVFNYKNGPTYRCIFPEPPEPGTSPACSEIGVIGVLPGLIGTMQANEVIKLVLGFAGTLSGRLLLVNARTMAFNEISISRNENLKDITKQEYQEFDYAHFCGLASGQDVILNELNLQETFFLDVREEFEAPRLDTANLIEIPLNELKMRLNELDSTKEMVVVCQAGVRSLKAIEILKSEGFTKLKNLKGGIIANF